MQACTVLDRRYWWARLGSGPGGAGGDLLGLACAPAGQGLVVAQDVATVVADVLGRGGAEAEGADAVQRVLSTELQRPAGELGQPVQVGARSGPRHVGPIGEHRHPQAGGDHDLRAVDVFGHVGRPHPIS